MYDLLKTGAHCVAQKGKMAASKLAMPQLKMTRSLEYTNIITKIPELKKVACSDYYLLPCANDHSLVVIYDNPFDILGVIYGIKDLCQKVLSHIKQSWKYYSEIGKSYLNLKKLDLVNWMVSLMTRDLPADELCLHVICTYLNLHITVDFHGGILTTLNITNVHHDLAMTLSDVHLAYRGYCRYGLLCKNVDLKTIGRKLMDHKIQNNQKLTKKLELVIPLHRVEEWNTSAEKLLNEEISSLELSKLDMYSTGTIRLKAEDNNIESDSTELYEMYENITGDNTNSDSTKLYDKHENIIGTIYYCTSTSQLPFKCPVRTCKTREKTRKEISDHYRHSHNKANKCKLCQRKYSAPHSLMQPLYKHDKLKNRYICKCGATFPFRSQIKIHKLKHTRKLNNPCTECSLPFKHYHDMLKHRRSHTAKEYSCDHCNYTGTKINLKAHQTQHDLHHIIKCKLCKETFKHRMSLWRHKRNAGEAEARIIDNATLSKIMCEYATVTIILYACTSYILTLLYLLCTLSCNFS